MAYNTYAVQRAQPSGEMFVVEYDDDNTILGICGPLDPQEQELAIQGIAEAGSFDYEPTTHTQWGSPIALYDPNTGMVWRRSD